VPSSSSTTIIGKPFTEDQWKDLSFLMFGKTQNSNGKKTFPEEWKQGFFFKPFHKEEEEENLSQFSTTTAQLGFGLIQLKGGPCGILAVMQSYILKQLLSNDASLPRSER
jgi:hypothetical protein